ncbi:MAG: hypothetical protein HOP19_27065, partial [Acidobacteria bacterium]|nr:hypothetical protein [Acidobacteriota bacterium]
DIKGGVNYRLYKLLDDDDQRFDRRVIQRPFAEEFSRAEINHFVTFMHGYLEGYFETLKPRWQRWFFRTVQCEFIVYGFRHGRFFNRSYPTEASYRKALKKAEERQKLAPAQPEETKV